MYYDLFNKISYTKALIFILKMFDIRNNFNIFFRPLYIILSILKLYSSSDYPRMNNP